jgi:hypothetical protein
MPRKRTAVTAEIAPGPESLADVREEDEAPPPPPDQLPLPRLMLWVDRKRAEHYLDHVLRPRPISGPDIDRYARDMSVPGRWRSRNADSLTFSWTGVVDWTKPECGKYECAGREFMEGRQRMLALIQAIELFKIKGLYLEFAFDVNPDDMGSINTGRSRSDRDRTAIMGGGEVPDGAYSVARKVVAWTRPGCAGSRVFRFNASQDELDEVLGEHGKVIAAGMEWAVEAARNTKLAPSLLGFGYWLITQADPELSAGFLADVGGRGANLTDASMALLFRSRVATELEATRSRGAKWEHMILALLCTAWNCHVTLVDNARARVAAQEAGRQPPRAVAPFKKLQLPAGDLVQANFPLPRQPKDQKGQDG